ncbi:MAG: family 16 glycoside hydrolase [Phycisphaerales bacterium]
MLTHTLAGVLAASLSTSDASPPIRALLITGHNNHNWQYTSRVHQETLEATGRFAVDVTDDFPATLQRLHSSGAPPVEYRLFVLDYNDHHAPKRWGAAAETWFVDRVRAGAGVVVIHSANNAFKGWADYESMVGLAWRDGSGHGDFHEFTINLVDREHPITQGMSDFTTADELYHKLVNPQRAEFTLLAQAFDRKEIRGSGANEPMAFTLSFGSGRVFATPLGHVWTNTGAASPGTQAQKRSILNDGFRTLFARGAEWAATGRVTLPPTWTEPAPSAPRPLTPAEKAAGWEILFDGTSSAGWKGFRRDAFPDKGWSIRDGMLIHAAGGSGGDICTEREFADFEFECEWRVAPGGNSGIMYRCSEDHQYPWQTGREYQILDDAAHQDGKKDKTRAATMYDIFACSVDVVRPAGHWNRARVVCHGTRIEHWLNGFRVVATDTAGDEYAQALAASKFPKMNLEHFGKPTRGRIALQDHGDEVAFRNIRVREIR